MKEDIKNLLVPIIKNSLRDLNLAKVSDGDIILDFPADSRFGDLSTNLALVLSRSSDRSPFEVATNIITNIKKNLEKSP